MDKTKIAVEIFNKNALGYQAKFMDIGLYKDSFDVFCKNIQKQNAQILEVACGPGNITKYLLEKKPDLKILATDLSENMLSLAKKNNPSTEFQLMDCRNIALIQKKFDGIVCGFGLPYLSKKDATQFIIDAAKLLKKDGLLYLSTIEDDYNKSGFKTGSTGEQMYMHYHQADTLTKALKKNNLEILVLQRIVSKDNSGIETIDLVLLAKKIGERKNYL